MKYLLLLLMTSFINSYGQTYADIYIRGMSKAQSGNHYEAIANFSMCIKLDSTDSYAYFYRGISKHKLGDNNNALIDFNKALKIEPSGDFILKYRAELKISIKDYYGAISDCIRILEISSKNYYAHVLMGIAKVRLGDINSGCEDFNLAKSKGIDVSKLIKICSL